MFKRRLFAIVCTLLPVVAFAQTRFLQTPEEGRKVTEEVVASVAANNLGSALKVLRPLSVIQSTDFDVFEAQVNSQQANLMRQFGAAHGYEFVKSDKIGSHLVRYQYFVFHEKAAMRWNFVLYQAEKGWVLSHFAFDANAVNFFE